MQTLLKCEQEGSYQFSSVTCRKHNHAHLVQLCEWASEEKPSKSPPAPLLHLDRPCSKYHTAQSAIYLSALIFFTFSLFLFILSAVDYSLPGLVGAKIYHAYSAVIQVEKTSHISAGPPLPHKALRGLGTVYRRGSRAMSELIVAHLSEETSPNQLRLFIRTLFRGGAMARGDLVVLFPSSPPDSYASVIQEEIESFRQLVSDRFAAELKLELPPVKDKNCTTRRKSLSAFNFDAYKHLANDSDKESRSLWGSSQKQGVLAASSVAFPAGETAGGVVPAARAVAWGSVVGFEAAELNPEDALNGFIDAAEMQTRRWACYEMLLGKVRRRFRHVLAVGVEATLVLGDPLAATRKRKAPYLLLAYQEEGQRRRPRAGPHLEEKRRRVAASSAAFAGSLKRARELSAAMSVGIVRMALERRSRAVFHDSAVLSRLVQDSEQGEEFLNNQPLLLSLPADNRQARRGARSGEEGKRHHPPIVHSSTAAKFRRFADAVWLDICADGNVYSDCGQSRAVICTPN